MDTGAEAIEVARAYRPDLALVDVGLPDIDGDEVARRLREELGPAPVLATMTGFTGKSFVRRSLQVGCDRHLTKPVSGDDLEDLLRKVERRAQT